MRSTSPLSLKALLTNGDRVEGRGPATIHDVKLSPIEPDTNQPTSPLLEGLLHKKALTEKALTRTNQSISALEKYIEKVGSASVKSSELGALVQDYESSMAQLDEKVMELEKELKDLNKKINAERENVAPKSVFDLGYRVSVAVVSEKEVEVDLVLIYGACSTHVKCQVRV